MRLMADAKVFCARVVLTAYLAFLLVVSGINFWSRSQKELHEFLVPLTGWVGIELHLFTMFFAFGALVDTNRCVFSHLLSMLGTAITLNAFDTASHALKAWSGHPDYGNPYLMYHPLRPLIILGIPSMWLAALWFVSRKLPPEQKTHRRAR